MSTGRRPYSGVLLVIVLVCQVTAAAAAEERVLAGWEFDASRQWAGWWPNGQIRDVKFYDTGVNFRTDGNDPIMTGPLFELAEATNSQWIEIDIDCDGESVGELYYTNTTTDPFGGFRRQWASSVVVPSGGRQVVNVWPFWENLGKIIRLRFDPPSGTRCRLYGIRIMGSAQVPHMPSWTFDEDTTSWHAMYAARLDQTDGGLTVKALKPQALIVAPVEPFDAARRSVLRLDFDCPGEHLLGFYWVTREHHGLFGVPISLDAGSKSPRDAVDLRQFPDFDGTVTHLAIGFGTRGQEVLTVRSISIEENDRERPFLRLRHCRFDKPINRTGKPVDLVIELEHAGGADLPATQVHVTTDEAAVCESSSVVVPSMGFGDRATVRSSIVPRSAGLTTVTLTIGDQTFVRSLRIDEPVGAIERGEYEVPPPRPVETDYQIGIYYFPGWSPDQMSRWHKQADFPERDSVLGWYEEGSPQVADWHIKWAVENAISFFVYDWYWSDGKEDLAAGLNEGFLKARYCDRMKFAVMWANHGGYARHTPEQLLTVTDYWIDRYFRRPNYLTVEGKPYVSFFSTGELFNSLGSAEAIAKAFEAMREQVREAGLSGLHIGACGGTNRGEIENLKRAGFDSVTGYNYRRTGATTLQSPYRQFLLGHEVIWDRIHAADVLPYIPLLTVGWDSRPWHGPRAEARFARRTCDFAEALGRLKANLDKTGQKTAILEAWNEWGEGSYIEPNAGFGFKDLEAIRSTFARPGNWPANIVPADAGTGDKYDLRGDDAGTRACLRLGKSVVLAGVRPGVREGLVITCWEDRIVVGPGCVQMGDKMWHSSGGTMRVPAADIVHVDRLPIRLNTTGVKSWQGGNRLTISVADRRNLLPGSYVAGSCRLADASDPAMRFGPGHDFIVDDVWGAFSLNSTGRLAADRRVVASYRMSLRRIDALVLDSAGKVAMIPGTPSADCPEPPAVGDDLFHLANVYRPFNATAVAPHQVYVPTGEQPDLSPLPDHPALTDVLAKLREGGPVTVVCWGDSVTVGGDASTKALCYVGLFESMLRQRFGPADIRVINAGIGGSNTRQRFPDFQTEVLDHGPDLVTLEFVNDMGFSPEEMQDRYGQILQRTRQAGAALVLITPHFTSPAWMPLPTGRGPDPRAAVAFLRKFAAENNVPLADTSRRWEQLEQAGIPYETLLKNGINHPDDRGHRLFAGELMRFFPK